MYIRIAVYSMHVCVLPPRHTLDSHIHAHACRHMAPASGPRLCYDTLPLKQMWQEAANSILSNVRGRCRDGKLFGRKLITEYTVSRGAFSTADSRSRLGGSSAMAGMSIHRAQVAQALSRSYSSRFVRKPSISRCTAAGVREYKLPHILKTSGTMHNPGPCPIGIRGG